MEQSNVTIREATLNDIPAITQLAEKTWWPTYSPILTPEQIRYMLDNIYSESSLRNAIESEAQKFLLLYENDSPHGFASFGIRPDAPDVCKLHKIYVLPEDQGKGYGKKLIEQVIRLVKEKGKHILDLNVNRYNPARAFYEKMGFRIIREEDVPIGPYWMNDYVMRIEF